ncbi:MAG TPA: hypothetical protein VKR06_12110 [Ktedonosporobacter sp.]|nr:hypothetical protein [Ktedonosporobacter sp.]
MKEHSYLREKLWQWRQQELQQHLEQQRMLAQAARQPRNTRNIGRHVAGRTGIMLIKLGIRLHQLAEN